MNVQFWVKRDLRSRPLVLLRRIDRRQHRLGPDGWEPAGEMSWGTGRDAAWDPITREEAADVARRLGHDPAVVRTLPPGWPT